MNIIIILMMVIVNVLFALFGFVGLRTPSKDDDPKEAWFILTCVSVFNIFGHFILEVIKVVS